MLPGSKTRLWLLGTVLLGSLLMADAAWAGESRLIDFEIQDQFKDKHRDEDHRGRILVVIGSDRHASKFNQAWGKALADSLGEERATQVDWLAVADTRGVPFFVKGMVRGKFPKDRAKWALTDWDGAFAKAYDWIEKSTNILVFDSDGALVGRHHGTEVNGAEVPRLCDMLDELLMQTTAATSAVDTVTTR